MSDSKIFFVVGAQKTGTTALYESIRNCENFETPKRKEFHLLAEEQPVTKAKYLFELGVANGISGDFSPSYLYSKFAAKNISNYFPDAKIIMVLRNPMQRAFSNMVHCVRLGKDQKLDLDDLLNNEEDRVRNKTALFHYLSKGFYYNQVKRFTDLFSQEQLLIIPHDQLIAHPTETVSKIINFVGLTESTPPSLERKNTGHVGKFGFSKNIVLLYNQLNEKGIRIPEALKNLGKRVFLTAPEKPTAEWFKLKNNELYLEDIQNLEGLIGQDLSSWYK